MTMSNLTLWRPSGGQMERAPARVRPSTIRGAVRQCQGHQDGQNEGLGSHAGQTDSHDYNMILTTWSSLHRRLPSPFAGDRHTLHRALDSDMMPVPDRGLRFGRLPQLQHCLKHLELALWILLIAINWRFSLAERFISIFLPAF